MTKDHFGEINKMLDPNMPQQSASQVTDVLRDEEMVEAVAVGIVTACVVDKLAVDPMPDEIARTLAKAAISAIIERIQQKVGV